MGEKQNAKNQDRLIFGITNNIYTDLGNYYNSPDPSLKAFSRDVILTNLKLIPGITTHFSDEDLFIELSVFLDTLSNAPSKTDSEEKKRLEYFIRSLGKQKSCEAIIIIPSLIDLPVGTRIGCLEIINNDIDDPDFIEFKEYYGLNRRIDLNSRVHAKVLFKSYKWINISKVLHDHLELPFGILSLIFMVDLDVRVCLGIIKSVDETSIIHLSPQTENLDWARYVPVIHSYLLEHLSSISLDNNCNRLRKKILQAIQLYGLSRLSQKQEIRFIFLISSFESLLLSKNDMNYLGKRLSEKTAFLLGNDFDSRVEIYNNMKDFYDKRSTLIHSGSFAITKSDVETLDILFHDLITNLLDLSRTYATMEHKSKPLDPEGIEDLIRRKMFS